MCAVLQTRRTFSELPFHPAIFSHHGNHGMPRSLLSIFSLIWNLRQFYVWGQFLLINRHEGYVTISSHYANMRDSHTHTCTHTHTHSLVLCDPQPSNLLHQLGYYDIRLLPSEEETQNWQCSSVSRQTGRQTDRQAGRHYDRQLEKAADRQSDRQTDSIFYFSQTIFLFWWFYVLSVLSECRRLQLCAGCHPPPRGLSWAPRGPQGPHPGWSCIEGPQASSRRWCFAL